RPYLSPPATTLGVTWITPTTRGAGWLSSVTLAVAFVACHEPFRYSSMVSVVRLSGMNRTRYLTPAVTSNPLHVYSLYVWLLAGATSERSIVPVRQPFSSKVHLEEPGLAEP